MRLRKSPAGQGPPSGAPVPGAGTVPSQQQEPRPAESRPPEGRRPIGQVLLENGSITPDQLAVAVVQQAASGKRLGELLIELGMAGERQVIAALAAQLRLPVIDLGKYRPDPRVVGLLNESQARSSNAIPIFAQSDGTIVVACSDPSPGLASELSTTMRAPVQLALAGATELKWAMDNSYRALSGVEGQVKAFTAVHGSSQELSATDAAISAGVDDAPVVQVVNMIITQALRDRVSDVHIEPQDDAVRVRYRIDGALHDILSLPGSIGPALVSRIKIMAGMNIVERRRPQDGQIQMTVEKRHLDIRISTIGVIWGEKVVMRILDRSRSLYQLRALGMTEQTYDSFAKMLRSPFGMVLCSGPTGSGKTTTLYASLNEINSPERNVTTIEDPVEYVFPSITQIPINEAAGVTFAGGLRSILRQDPDMILVGEIRDVETARIAIQSALTGHFVLSSVHATDAVSSLYRFLDMGIESFLVSASVLGIVGQRLVRLICEHCREPHTPTSDELAFFRNSGGNEGVQFWAGKGCNYCTHTGYSGRIGVYELLTVTEQMRELLVRPEATHADIRSLAIAEGMQPLRIGGVRLIESGQTSIAEIIRSIYIL